MTRFMKSKPGLGARLAVALVALVGVLLLAYGWWASRLAENTLKGELGAKLGLVAKLAAVDEKVRALPYAIRAGAVVEAARPRLIQVAEEAGIANLMVVDRKERVLVDAKGKYKFRDTGWQLQLDRAELKRVWRGEVAASPIYAGQDGGLYLSAYAPLVVDGAVRAVVCAEASAAFLHSFRKLPVQFAVAGLIVLVLAAGLGLWMGRTLTKVERLTAAYETQRRFAAIGEMAAEVAHQIRNPLAAIQGFAGLLKTEIGRSGRAKEFLNDLLNEVKATERIVSNFLQLASPERLALEPIHVDETVNQVCRAMQAEFDQAGIRLDRAIETPLPVIQADAREVQQALSNLLRNALEACSTGGRVLVRAAAANGASRGVDIAIEDDGAGLAPEIRPKLFTPFVTTKARGTGLGLSLAKKVVEAHGGTIALSPLGPRGTRAEVHLPVKPQVEA